MRALQVHPESGKLWEKHINNILFSDELNFKTTTHDRTIYKTIYEWKIVFLFRQVDDFALAFKEESTAKEIYDIISRSLRLEKEPCDLFSYLDLVSDFKGVDIEQSSEYIQISCSEYIDRVLTTHNWTTPMQRKPSSKPIGPLPADAIQRIYKESGPAEGTVEHQALEARSRPRRELGRTFLISRARLISSVIFSATDSWEWKTLPMFCLIEVFF